MFFFTFELVEHSAMQAGEVSEKYRVSHSSSSFPERVFASDKNIPLLSYIRKLTQSAVMY